MIAYFTMEVGLESDLPTYSGGLGVLAGDTLRSCADLGLPMVAVSLVHREGYVCQTLSRDGVQSAAPQPWPRPPGEDARVRQTDAEATVRVEGRPVNLRAWRYNVRGHGPQAREVPVFLLDADLPENDPRDRRLTDRLYGSGRGYRLGQELVLGVGGVRILRSLGYAGAGRSPRTIRRYHLNEGHAALVAAELLRELVAPEAVRARCAFTTHTPVPAGHDHFPRDLAERVVGQDVLASLWALGLDPGGDLDMSRLALAASEWCNGVARRHAEVSREMFPRHADRIHAVTNGVHAATWAAPPIAALFDAHLPDWRDDPSALRNAAGRISAAAMLDAHAAAKAALLAAADSRTPPDGPGGELRPGALTLGFARRATPYKRLHLLLCQPERLAAISSACPEPLQLILAGKAHPDDQGGQDLIRHVHEAARHPALVAAGIQVRYLAGYDMNLGRLLTSGVDVWVNTPRPPREASGTSGMKAALNGVPNLSTPDGWWLEGRQEGVTGWTIDATADSTDEHDAASLLDKLEQCVVPAFHGASGPDAYATVMRNAIALNASWFHTHRMVKDYAAAAWLR